MIPLRKVFMAPEAPEAVARTLRSGMVTQGPRVDEFEAALGDLMGLEPPPITVCSGTAGMDLIWHLLGIGPGTEVLSTPMTCVATNCGLATRGARIVWCDVDPTTGLIDPTDVVRKVTKRTRAIVAVDWAGRSCDYDTLCSIGPPVVQDAAHSFLASRRDGGCPRGNYTMWSFQAVKHLNCADGGAIYVPMDQYERARRLRWYGFDRRLPADHRLLEPIQEVGYKYQMNDVAAAIGLANVPYVRGVIDRHQANAKYYWEALHGARRIVVPPPDPGSSWWLYCILTEDREGFIRFMAGKGFECGPGHVRNDLYPCMRYWGGDLPGLAKFASQEVAIPVGWWVTDAEREAIADTVLEWNSARRGHE